MKTKKFFSYVLILPLLFFALYAGEKREESLSKTNTEQAGGAVITGKVILKGKAPKTDKIVMTKDPNCVKFHSQPVYKEEVVVNPNGTLQNVFVYVKSGLGNRSFPAPKEEIVFDQKGCQYYPHIFGMQAKQPLKIMNSDPTLHNIHALPKNSKQFNNAQPKQGMTMIKTFDNPEVMVKIKCEVHNWMSAYVGVLNHPFYSVTSKEGTFTLKGLPAGEYVVEAWHEKYGSASQTVKVGEKETKQIEFTFEAK